MEVIGTAGTERETSDAFDQLSRAFQEPGLSELVDAAASAVEVTTASEVAPAAGATAIGGATQSGSAGAKNVSPGDNTAGFGGIAGRLAV